MTMAEIITSAKRRLRGFGNITWGETELLEFANEGYQRFAIYSKCLRKSGTVAIVADTATFSLPTDLLELKRATWDDVALKVRTTEFMDSMVGGNWREAEGTTILCLIQDSEGQNSIRIYPILNDEDYNDNLAVEYVYLPTAISTTSESPSIPMQYHLALIEYILYMCQDVEVQSQKNPVSSNIHYQRFMMDVRRAKSDVSAGYGARFSRQVIPPVV